MLKLHTQTQGEGKSVKFMTGLHWRIMKCIRKAAERRILPDRTEMIKALEEEMRSAILEERERCAELAEAKGQESLAYFIRARPQVI